jgi:hypothetical protein
MDGVDGVDETTTEYASRIRGLEEEFRKARTTQKQVGIVTEILKVMDELFDKLSAELHETVVRHAEAVRGLRRVLKDFVVDDHIEELAAKFIVDLAREFGYEPNRRSLDNWIYTTLYRAWAWEPEGSAERERFQRLWENWKASREG